MTARRVFGGCNWRNANERHNEIEVVKRGLSERSKGWDDKRLESEPEKRRSKQRELESKLDEVMKLSAECGMLEKMLGYDESEILQGDD